MSAKNTKADSKPKSKKAGGRKTKYNEEVLEHIKAWARDGLTEKEMCAKIGVSQWSFNEWKKKHPQLPIALKENKEAVDDSVELSLLKRARGYDYDEITEIDGPLGFTRKVVKKHIPPSEVACFFWLQNRRREKWRKKQEIDLNDNGNMQELINAVKGIFNS